MQQHINELMGVVNDLRLTGIKIKGMDVVMCLLITLSSEFDVIKISIKNQPNENLSLNFVIQTQKYRSSNAK